MGFVAVGVLALSLGQIGFGERWFSILYRGARIGTAVERVGAVEGDERAMRIDRCATRRFLRQGASVADESCFRALVDKRDGAVLWFEFESRAGRERHRVEAEWLGDRLVILRPSQGKSGRDEVALSSPPRLASLVKPSGHGSGAERGQMPRVVESARGFVVDDESGVVGSLADFRAVATRLRVVRHERVSEAVARAPFRTVEVMNDTAIHANVRLPANRPVRRLRLRFHGGLGAAMIPEDYRQRIVGPSDDRALEIVGSPSLSGAGSAQRFRDLPDEITELAEKWRLVGSSNDIKALVRRIADGGKSPGGTARRLSWFVNRTLVSKRASHLLGSAEEALRSGSGDCTEHAALLSRLLELAGIRSRVVLGLIYSDNAFRLHHWVEASVGRADEWRPLDPMFGDDEIDATYVKLQSFGAEGAYFQGAATFLDSLSSTKAELIAADFGSGWRSLSRRR